MNFYSKKVRTIMAVIIIVLIAAMIGTSVVPYLF